MYDKMRILSNNLWEIFKFIHQKSYHKLENECLYPGQPKLLALIKDNEGITQKELSIKNCVQPSTITGMLNKLESNHYVYRVPDEADKRMMRVYLTPEGLRLAHQGDQFLKSLLEQIYEGFTEEELQTFVTLTDKMKHNLLKDKN